MELDNRYDAATALWKVYEQANLTDCDDYSGDYPKNAASSVCRPLEAALEALGVNVDASVRDGELYIYTHVFTGRGWENGTRIAPTGRGNYDWDGDFREAVIDENGDEILLNGGWENRHPKI